MSTETRPTLQGLDDAQRTLAMAHWWLWLVHVSHVPGVDWAAIGCTPANVLGVLEAGMTSETKHRLAQARDRYWKETESGRIDRANH